MSSFFVTGGTLRFDARSYVERQADRQLYQGLLAGDFCYVLTSRQMGKSSLMVRTASRLRADGVRVVVLDLTAIGQNVSPDQWYYGLLVRAGEQLGVEDELDAHWNANPQVGPCQRFFAALRQVALDASPKGPKLQSGLWASEEGERKRLVVFVDEIDVVKSVTFSTDEFFAAIRECYNRRTEDPEFSRMTFCLLGVAMPSELIRDTRLTPFNIGRRIELTDFTPEEAAILGTGFESGDGPGAHLSRLLRRVLFWTGGHPYLTQRVCQALSQQLFGQERLKAGTVDSACAELFFSSRASERDDNLIFVRERLLRNGGDVLGLLTLYQRVLRRKHVPDDDTNAHVSTLRLSGVVRSEKGRLVERNRIYGHVFDWNWVQAHMPNAEVQRQRAAYRLGLIRATSMAMAIIVVLVMMMGALIRKSGEVRRASGQAFVAQAEATLVSGSTGQRARSLEGVDRAIGIYDDQQKLRNLTIAALALPDIREHRRLATNASASVVSAVDETFEIYAAGDAEGNVTVRRTRDEAILGRIPGFGVPAEYLLFSRAARYLAVKYRGATVLWDRKDDHSLLVLPFSFNHRAVTFSADETKFALADAEGNLDIYSFNTAVTHTLSLRLATGRPRSPHVLRFDPSGSFLAEGCQDSFNVQVWNLKTKEAQTLAHRDDVNDLAWHPQGYWLATACKDRDIHVWNLATVQRLALLHGHEAEVSRVAFSHDGNLLASAGSDQTLRLWAPWTGRQLVHHVQDTQADALQFSRDDLWLSFKNSAGSIEVFNVNPSREYRVLQKPPGSFAELHNLDFSPDGRLLTAATDKGVVLWDVEQGTVAAHLNVATARSAMFDALTGELLATSRFGMHRWPRQEVNGEGELSVHFGPPQEFELPAELGKLATSSDSAVAAVLHEKHIHVIGLRDSRSIELQAEDYYSAAALSPDGRRLAARARDASRLDLWDIEAKQRLPVSLPTAAPHFGFSPDGKWLVTSSPQEYQFWDVTTWRKGPAIRRQSGNVGPMAFARFSSIFAISLSPSAVELRAMPDGVYLATLENPDRRAVRSLTLSPLGRRLAAVTVDDVVLIWDLALIQQQLAQRKLNGAWTFSAQLSPAIRPLRVTVDSGPVPATRPGHLLELERLTTSLKTAPENSSKDYQQRGVIYLRNLDRPHDALRDFLAAMRLDADNDELKSLKAEAEAMVQTTSSEPEY